MTEKRRKVLVIAPGRKTRGGITAVVNSYTKHPLWDSWQCYWLETHIDRNFWLKLWYFISALGRYFFILPSYHIIHIHFSEPVSAIRKMFFMVPALVARRKVILHFHSFSPDTTISSRFRPLYRWMFEHAHSIIVLSDSWKREVANISEKQLPISVIYNPAMLRDFSGGQRESYILFAGTLNSRKGYSDLIRAFSMVAGRHPKWKLVLAGNGETREADVLARSLRVRDKVMLPGWVSGSDKEILFRKAGIFCLPSYAEGFPMAVIDAMSHYVPVVSTPAGGVTDVFRDGEELLLTNAGNVYELAGKLDMMIRHPVMRQRMADAAGRKISAHFSLEIVAGQLNKLYQKLNA
jgi:glycosyltransferase involved in cell wall biosynthesis